MRLAALWIAAFSAGLALAPSSVRAACEVDSLAITTEDSDWRYACGPAYVVRAFDASGQSLWSFSTGYDPIVDVEIVEVYGAPYVLTLLGSGDFQIRTCSAHLIGTVELDRFASPRSWSSVFGTIEDGTVRLWGSDARYGGSELYHVSFAAADLWEALPFPDANLRWEVKFEGIEIPFDRYGAQRMELDESSGELVVVTAARVESSDWYECPEWERPMEYRFDPATGALTSPTWLGDVELDASDPEGQTLIARTLEGSEAWRHTFATPIHRLIPLEKARGGWTVAALVEGDPNTAAPPALCKLDVTGIEVARLELPYDPSLESGGILWSRELPFPVPFGPLCAGYPPHPDVLQASWEIAVGQPGQPRQSAYHLDPLREAIAPSFVLDFFPADENLGTAPLSSDVRLFVGELATGHGVAFASVVRDCGATNSTLLFDGSQPHGLNVGGFVEILPGTSFSTFMLRTRDDELVPVSVGTPHMSVVPHPIVDWRANGSTLHVNESTDFPLGSIELSGTVIDARPGRGLLDCLVDAAGELRVERVSTLFELHSLGWQRWTPAGADVRVDTFPSDRWAMGADFVVSFSDWEVGDATTWVHDGALGQVFEADLFDEPGTEWFVTTLFGDSGHGELNVLYESTRAAASGPGGVVPDQFYRWDGSDPRLPAAGAVASLEASNADGDPFLLATLDDGRLFALGPEGPWPEPSLELRRLDLPKPGEIFSAQLVLHNVLKFENLTLEFDFDLATLWPAGMNVECCELRILESSQSTDHLRLRLALPAQNPPRIDASEVVLGTFRFRVADDALPGPTVLHFDPAPVLGHVGGQTSTLSIEDFVVDIPCPGNDVDGDGALSIEDARAMMRSIAELQPLDARAACVADRDRDGAVGLDDVVAVLREIEGEPPLPHVAAKVGKAGWELESLDWDGRDALVTLRLASAAEVSAVDLRVAPANAGFVAEQAVLWPQVLQVARDGEVARVVAATTGSMREPRVLVRVRALPPLLEPLSGIRVLAGSALDAVGTSLEWNDRTLDLDAATGAIPPPPTETRLLQNAPNPFNAGTTVTVELAKRQTVRLEVFDALGRRVRELAHGPEGPGFLIRNWDGRSDAGRSVASGTYFCRFLGEATEQVVRMVLIK